VSKLKLPEADDSRDFKALQTAEKTVIKDNNGSEYYNNSSFCYLSSNFGYVEATPVK
jgi:hypothetical protein